MRLSKMSTFMCAMAAIFSGLVYAGQAPDLAVTITDGLTNVAPGATLVYSLTLTNNTAVDATNATATASVPDALSFTSSPNGGVFANKTVTFSNLSVPANTSILVQYNAAVINPLPAGTPKTFTTTATVSVDPAQGVDPNLADNSANDTDTLILSPDPVICTLTDGLACTFANGLQTYTAEACNIGNIGVTGVVVTNTIPVGTTFVSADNGGTFANGVVTWPPYSIAGGVHTFRSVTVKVNSPLPAGVTQLIDTATITDDGLNGTDANPGNNTITDTDCILPSSFLVIIKVVDLTNPNIGDTINYTITVTNNGPDTASNVTVTDSLPAGLTLITATQTAGNYDTTNGLWTVGSLINGTVATLKLSATVNANPPGTITNTACVSNQPEINSNSAANCATVIVTPGCGRRPGITSGPTAMPSVAVAGTPITYSVVTNSNGSTIPVVVTWDFGDGTTGTGSTVQHTFTSGGSFTIKATVANACGGAGTTALLTTIVMGTPSPLQCSLLHATFNLANANSDSLSLVAQFNVPVGFNPAGKKILVQINNFDFSATLDASGRYKDASHSATVKALGTSEILALKISHSSLRTLMLPNLAAGSKTTKVKDVPFLITIGNQSFGNAIDTIYTSKSTTATLTK